MISPKFHFLGASPDGVVNCECHGCGLLEIKCSHKYHNQQPTAEMSDSSYFLKRGENSNIYLSRSHKYYHQVQGKIALCNSMYCDFATWTTKGFSMSALTETILHCRCTASVNFILHQVSVAETSDSCSRACF